MISRSHLINLIKWGHLKNRLRDETLKIINGIGEMIDQLENMSKGGPMKTTNQNVLSP